MCQSATENPEQHGVPLGDVAIYYRFAFTTGVELHPNDAARRALNAEFALTAVDAWGAVSVMPVMADAMDTLGRLRETARVASGRWAIARFILRHPLLSARVLMTRRAEDESGGESSKSVDDSLNDVRQSIADMAVLDGFASQVDQDVVRPHYLATEPWIRLALPPVTVRHRGDVDDHTLEVNLLLHRCGQAVMTFGLLFAAPDGDAGIDRVNAWANGSAHDLVATTFDARVLRYGERGAQWMVGSRRDEQEHGGRPTVAFDRRDDPVSLGDIFNLYRDALIECLTGKPLADGLGEWQMIPVISIRGLDNTEHARVGPLLAMHVRTERLTASTFRPPDQFVGMAAHTYAADVWISVACVVHIAKNSFRSDYSDSDTGAVPGEAWFRAEAPICLAVDLALLRIGLTSTLSQRLSSATSAREIERVALSALAHFELLSGERLVRVGELSQVESALLERNDYAAQTGALVQQRELAEGVAASMQARKSQRLARRTEGFVIVLTIVVALLGSIGVLLQLHGWDDRFVIAGEPFSVWGRWALVAVPALASVVCAGALVAWQTGRGVRWFRAGRALPLAPRPLQGRRVPRSVPLGGLRFVMDDGIEQPIDSELEQSPPA